MEALSGKAIIVIITCITIVVIAAIVTSIVVIYSVGESTTHLSGSSTTTAASTTEGTTWSSTTSTNPTTTGGCISGWIGDNYCDDINNNMGCSYDGGDCCDSCGSVVNMQWCLVCACLDPNGSGGGTTCPTTPNLGSYAPALNCSLLTGKKHVKMIVTNIFVNQVLFCIGLCCSSSWYFC